MDEEVPRKADFQEESLQHLTETFLVLQELRSIDCGTEC